MSDILNVVGEPSYYEITTHDGIKWVGENRNTLPGHTSVGLYTESQLQAAYRKGMEWKEAALDQCMVAHSAFYEDDPKKTLDTLVDWHVKIALDPQICSDAQALINKGAEEMREAIIEKLLSLGALGDGEYLDAIRALPIEGERTKLRRG